MNKHLFRLLFGALFLVAATVFTGCKEDDSKSATPTLSVSTESLVFTDATEKTQTVDIKANCEWKVVASDLSWATVEPMNGRGNGTISVAVQELPAGTNSREGKISFTLTLIHAEFGNWGTAEQSIAVSQIAGSEVPTGEIAYANNFDKEAATQTYGSGNSWPYTDQFDGWKNESGYGIADVTYTTSGISVRNNSNSNNNYSDYAGSGVNNLLFSSNSNFTIEKIAVNSVNLRLTFGTERYAYGEDDNTFNHDEFKVQLSNDGTNWSAPLTYTFAMGVDPNGRWDLASSDFSLPEGTTSLYIRFRSTLSGAHRLDDVTLLEGAGGQAITFDYVEPEDPGMDTSDAIYFNDMDKEVASQTDGKWPYADEFDGWKNQTGSGAANVTYTTSGVSVRSNSPSDAGYSDYAGSGNNNLLFGTNGVVTIEKIAVSEKNLALSFGTERYLYGASDNTFNHDEFKVELSNDGTNWSSPLTYTFAKGVDPNGRWDLATADFTLPDGVSTLYVRFSSTLSGAHRLDDVLLKAGNGGQQVSFDGGGEDPDPETTTIGDITTAGNYKTEGTVVARGKMAYIIADNTGAMMVYHKDNERTVGEKISISGKVTIYNAQSTPQFSASATVEVLSSDNKWTYNPTKMDGAAMDALLSASPVCKEIEFEGNLVVDGNYVNVTIPGASTAIGSVKYIDNSTISQLNGKDVVVKGYFVGTSSGKYVNVLPYSVEEVGGSTDPEPDPEKTPIGEITTAGDYKAEGTVVARGKMAYIIADNTGAMMVYHKDNERSVGEKISISGEVTLYNAQSTPQFSASAEVEVLSTGNNWTYNPAKKDGAAMDALLSGTPVCTEIEFEGNLAISGNYVNVTIPGASTAVGSIKYIDNSTVAAYDGRDVLVKGYFVGTSSSRYVNVLPYSVEETNPSTDPEMTVDPASLSFPAAGGEKSVTVTTRNADGCTIEASSDNAKFSVSVSGTTVKVVAKENTSESKIEGTLTVKLMKAGSAVVTKTVALTQSGKSSSTGDGTTITMTYTDIINGGSDIPTNAYGTQNVNDESTYYKWSFSSLDFAGARVCIASSSDYKGLIQMQGNDSDVAKQGFFGNVTDLGKITKIVVVSVNTRYEPSVNLYLGTDKYPTTNVQAHPSYVKEGNVYTEEYEISGDYGYFRLWNDSVGATYIQSISITYSK